MKYRPDNWSNPYSEHGADLDETGWEIAFEAGADAMLDGLLKGESFEGKVYDKLGRWVFIPE